MFQVIIWLMIAVSVCMVLVVLAQRSKGGGLNQSFASQQAIIGVRKSTDFVEKLTWSLAGAMLAFSFIAVATLPNQNVASDSGLQQILSNTQAAQTQQPAFGAQAPAEEAAPAVETPAAEAPVAE